MILSYLIFYIYIYIYTHITYTSKYIDLNISNKFEILYLRMNFIQYFIKIYWKSIL